VLEIYEHIQEYYPEIQKCLKKLKSFLNLKGGFFCQYASSGGGIFAPQRTHPTPK
jgi:hypothetical protein